MVINPVTPEQTSRSLSFLRALATNEYILGDPSFPTDRLLEALLLTVVDQATRLASLETTVEGALNAAYVNYDPIVAQLSEVRREIVRMRADRVAEMADRDRLWCETLLRTLDIRDAQTVLAKFNKLRKPEGKKSSW